MDIACVYHRQRSGGRSWAYGARRCFGCVSQTPTPITSGGQRCWGLSAELRCGRGKARTKTGTGWRRCPCVPAPHPRLRVRRAGAGAGGAWCVVVRHFFSSLAACCLRSLICLAWSLIVALYLKGNGRSRRNASDQDHPSLHIHSMVWSTVAHPSYGMVWYGMVWYGMVWWRSVKGTSGHERLGPHG